VISDSQYDKEDKILEKIQRKRNNNSFYKNKTYYLVVRVGDCYYKNKN